MLLMLVEGSDVILFGVEFIVQVGGHTEVVHAQLNAFDASKERVQRLLINLWHDLQASLVFQHCKFGVNQTRLSNAFHFGNEERRKLGLVARSYLLRQFVDGVAEIGLSALDKTAALIDLVRVVYLQVVALLE